MAMGLSFFLSKGDLTARYIGSELEITRTYDFFLPILLVANLVVAITGIIILIFLSHRIAGPVYRFEKALGEIGKGDLTYRFKIRRLDDLKELADCINELTNTLDIRVGIIKAGINELSKEVGSEKLSALQEATGCFKTSKDQQNGNP